MIFKIKLWIAKTYVNYRIRFGTDEDRKVIRHAMNYGMGYPKMAKQLFKGH